MRHITTQNLAAFCYDEDNMWEMDGRPPEPSEIERAQARAGHVMSETDIAEMKDILHRSGIRVESRNLDKFETIVTDIALRLVDEEDEMDPATAGMDILDAVNDRLMTESTRRAAGTWYDPMKRALEILESKLPEDVFADMKARMATQADDYLKQRDSTLQTATTQQGVGDPEPEEEEEVTSLGAMARELENIRQTAMGNSYQLDQKSTQRLAQIINALQGMEKTAGQGIGMKFKRWTGMEAEIRQRAGLTEECECELMADEGGDEQSLHSLLSTQSHVLGEIIPQLRGIATHSVSDQDSKKTLVRIADQLASLQWKLHGQRERQSGQMWTDVEKQTPAWHGKV